jgi:hypothetical protein
MRKFKISIVFLLIVFLLTACKRKTGFEYILTSSECSAPCWMNIEPGKSTKKEVLSQLQNLPDLVDIESIFTRVYDGKEQVGWDFVNSDVTGQVEFKNDHVSSILIGYEFGETRKSGLQLGRTIEIYGSPQDIYYKTGIGDLLVNQVFLVNPENGIEYQYIQSDVKKLVITPDQIIHWVKFFSPNDSSEIVLPNVDPRLNDLDNYHFTWTGYTEIILHKP